MMTTLNTPDKKIITLEDPIEYELPGIVQSEVDEKKNYLYSTGLKALMRQDPDVIMIGEIRDLETAQIAVQSALTGHMVLSTLHTNDAATRYRAGHRPDRVWQNDHSVYRPGQNQQPRRQDSHSRRPCGIPDGGH